MEYWEMGIWKVTEFIFMKNVRYLKAGGVKICLM